MLTIDKMSRKPIYEQLVEGLEREIVTGLLPPQSQLPSIRELSSVLGVNPNTVQKALGELDALGIIISAPGRGMFVAEDATEKIRNRMSSKISEIQEISTALAKAGVDEETVLLAVREAYRASKS